MAPVRVIQWATGSVGKAAIEGILLHPDLELVGCWVHSDSKNGVDVGEILGIEPLGVARHQQHGRDPRDGGRLRSLYAPLIPNRDEVAAILRSGKNVVTPVGWFYPTERDGAPLAAACAEAGTTLHGTGINPGGITELHPLMFSALSSAVTFVRGEEFSDIRTYNAPDVVRHIMMFGGQPEEAMGGPMLGLLSGGFIQSVRMCLDTLGFSADAEIRTSQEVAVATAPIETPDRRDRARPGRRPAVRLGGVRRRDLRRPDRGQLADGRGAPRPRRGTFGPEGERFEVEVQGDPNTFVTIKGWQPDTVEEGLVRNPGVVATAMHCVNSIPYVVAAEPGIQTYLDLPLIAGRAHPDLR